MRDYAIVHVPGVGMGIRKEIHAHYAIIVFDKDGHHWESVLEHDDYTVVDEVSFAIKENE